MRLELYGCTDGKMHSPPPPFPIVGKFGPYLWLSLWTHELQKTKGSQIRAIFKISNALPAIWGTQISQILGRKLGTPKLATADTFAFSPPTSEYAPGPLRSRCSSETNAHTKSSFSLYSVNRFRRARDSWMPDTHGPPKWQDSRLRHDGF